MPNPNTALVTGASAGIGAVYADRLARRGHDLILVARDETRLNRLAERLRAETGRAMAVLVADLSDRTSLLRVERRLRDDPSIAMLVNNAGIAVAGPMLGSNVEKLQGMLDLNVTAPLRLAHAAVAGFVARGQGTLINVASVLALMPERFNATYSGTKAFLLNLSIAVTASSVWRIPPTAAPAISSGSVKYAVVPGATRTELWDKAGIDIATMPAERMMGAEDMVDAALAGLDMGEAVTIPSLPDAADWQRFEAARLALAPNLSRNAPAARYLAGR